MRARLRYYLRIFVAPGGKANGENVSSVCTLERFAIKCTYTVRRNRTAIEILCRRRADRKSIGEGKEGFVNPFRVSLSFISRKSSRNSLNIRLFFVSRVSAVIRIFLFEDIHIETKRKKKKKTKDRRIRRIIVREIIFDFFPIIHIHTRIGSV